MSYIELTEIDEFGNNKVLFLGDWRFQYKTTDPLYSDYTKNVAFFINLGITISTAYTLFSEHFEAGAYPFDGTYVGTPNTFETDRIILKNGTILYRYQVYTASNPEEEDLFNYAVFSNKGGSTSQRVFSQGNNVPRSHEFYNSYSLHNDDEVETSANGTFINIVTIMKYDSPTRWSMHIPIAKGFPYYRNVTIANITYPIYKINFNFTSAPRYFFMENNEYIINISEIFPGTNSNEDGGFGNFDDENEEVDFQDLPTISANDCGFITMFKPSTSQLTALSSYLWTSSFYDTIKKIFGDPIDALLGLSIIPLNPSTSSSRELKVGFVGTGITMPVINDQYMTVDCGSLTVSEYWGSALDYAPYTKLQLFLPYIGTKVLSTDDVMNKVIEVKYNIDILSGSLVAQVKCDGNVLYEFNGTCLSDLPISGRDFTQIIGNAIGTIGSVGVAIASGGATAVASGLAMANNVMNSKPDIQHSGNISSTCGLLSHQKPYLIIERPRQSLAENYKHFVGYPSNLTRKLSTLSGYTEIDNVFLDNLKATDDEKDEIYKLLLGGVIL